MATEQQIAANRANASRSTGPRMPEGKAASRFNAVKHGLLAEAALLPDERPEDIEVLREAIHEQLEPQGELETMLADRVVSCMWRLRRVLKVEAGLFVKEQYEEIARLARDRASRCSAFTTEEQERLMELLPEVTLRTTDHAGYAEAVERREHAENMLDSEAGWLGSAFARDAAGANAFSKLSAYEARIERSLYKALTELQALQAAHPIRCDSAPAATVTEIHTDEEPSREAAADSEAHGAPENVAGGESVRSAQADASPISEAA